MRARRTPARRGNTRRNGAAAGDVQAAGGDAPIDSSAAATGSEQASLSTSRTVSVSPHRLIEEPRISPMPSHDIVLTPRVLDQRAFDELSTTLQQLISQSQELSVELSRHIEAASALDAQATRASTRLQDRLHLSARMLKALQVQIDKLQSMQDEWAARTSAAEAAHQNQVAALNEHRIALAAQLDALATQLGDAMRTREQEAAQAMDEQAAGLTRRVGAAESKVTDLDATASRLTDLVVQAEKSITSVAYRAAQSAQRAEHVVEDAKRTLRQCEEARQHLGKDLMEAEERLTASARRADELTAQVEQAVARCEAAEKQFSRIAEAAGPFFDQLDRLERAVTDINALMPQLAPWEPLLLQSRTDPASLPAPLRALVDLVRAGMRGEMRDLAGSMRELAARMETMSAGTFAPAEEAPAHNVESAHSEGESVEERAAEIVTLPGAALSALARRSADSSAEVTAAASANC